jgi:hypothetical protein
VYVLFRCNGHWTTMIIVLKWGPVTLNVLIPHQTVTFSLCSGLSYNWRGLWCNQYLIFLLVNMSWQMDMSFENNNVPTKFWLSFRMSKNCWQNHCFVIGSSFFNCWTIWIYTDGNSGLDAIFDALPYGMTVSRML